MVVSDAEPVARLADVLTTEEVAAYLKVPVETLYTWRHKGTGPPALKVGRHLRYRVRDLAAWLEEQGP